MSKGRVLIVDDDSVVAQTISDTVSSWNYSVALASDGEAALMLATEFDPQVIITDILMPHLDGFGLLREVRLRHPETVVILLTGRGSVEMALRAIKNEGAFHYFEKPVDEEKLRVVLESAFELANTRRENEALRKELLHHGRFGELIGNTDAMRQIYSLIEQVAPSSVSVILTGESGTGKELVARTIHQLSPRRNNPFVAINCSAIPESLMESELFGHERGAFTGAAMRRQGCFELANTGTLLLDEIAEMPVGLQAKLLRTLEERKVRRLGSVQEVAIDVRLIAATNKDPQVAIDAGTFREDLLYRLNVITIHLPPLRERIDDLPLLAQHLVLSLAEKHLRPARMVSEGAIDVLKSHNWPGNIRELRNVIERAVIICSTESIDRHHLAPYPIDQRQRTRVGDTVTFPVGTPLEELERQMIIQTLRKTDNNKTKAALLLGISLKTLHNKLNQYRDSGQIPDNMFRRLGLGEE